jgi:hypothetical protein
MLSSRNPRAKIDFKTKKRGGAGNGKSAQRTNDERAVLLPYFTWETPYRSEYVAELNIEKFKLMKDGTARFSHPQGTHDDTFWATALAVSAATETKTVDIQTMRFG